MLPRMGSGLSLDNAMSRPTHPKWFGMGPDQKFPLVPLTLSSPPNQSFPSYYPHTLCFHPVFYVLLNKHHSMPKQNVTCKLFQWLAPYNSPICPWHISIRPFYAMEGVARKDPHPFHSRPDTVLYVSPLFSPVPSLWCSVASRYF